LPEDDLELLTLLIVDGYRQADVARLWNCSRSAIPQRINKI
ncbi:MAG: RNA polymerase subunit sigma-70, partial [Lachnospiraceae bacterium]|nr:RNA polymerase subunit sigma-70 [Lachnospiraceae bacterium]